KGIRTIGSEAVGHGRFVSKKRKWPAKQGEPVASLPERSTQRGRKRTMGMTKVGQVLWNQ
ncbi:MAG TPA: hypothetical protein VK513_01690, partial [Terriglobales bacterium]|nr:hypothetical protein [Terriglobales bacterium]